MIRTVSVDSSTKLSGLCLFVNGKYKEHILIDHHTIKDTDERINEMIKDIVKQLQSWNPDIVWIEHPQGHGRNVSMVGKLSEILGAVRCWCVCKKREYHEINPSEWRKWLPDYSQGGKARAELKKDSIAYVKEHLGLDCSDDEADSICVGLAVMEYYNSMNA